MTTAQPLPQTPDLPIAVPQMALIVDLPRVDYHEAFAEFLRIDVANGDASEDTIRSYRNQVAIWVAWCRAKGLDPALATPTHVKQYRQELVASKLKPISIGWMLSIVRRFYQAAVTAGLRADNPAIGVKPPRIRRAAEDFKYLDGGQLERLLNAVPDPEEAEGREKLKRMRNLLLLYMMALQGLRTIEVHRGNVEDLTERGEHLVMLVRGKTRDRIVYLRPDTAAKLREYLELRGEARADAEGTPLFTALSFGPIGPRLSRRHIRVQTDGYLRKAGLKRPGISNHALRHTAGTLGYLHTNDIRAVQELLGHTDPRMTSRYAHVVDMAKRNPALFIPVKTG